MVIRRACEIIAAQYGQAPEGECQVVVMDHHGKRAPVALAHMLAVVFLARRWHVKCRRLAAQYNT